MSAVIFYSAPKNQGKITGVGGANSEGYHTAYVLVNYADGPDQSLSVDINFANMSNNISPRESVCIDEVAMRADRIGTSRQGTRGGSVYSFPEPILCLDPSGLSRVFMHEDKLSELIKVAIQDPPYFYPYNNTEFRISVTFSGYPENNKDERIAIPLDVNWDFRAPGKDLRVVSLGHEPQDFPQPGFVASYLQIDMNTPFVFRALTPLLAILIFFFICFLPFIESSGEFAQAALGLVLGLWATREILVPADLRGTVLLDSIFVAAYAALAISVAFWLLMTYRSRNTARAGGEQKKRSEPKRKR